MKTIKNELASFELLNDVLFDTVKVPPQGGVAFLFTKTLTHGKSYVETNLYYPGSLPYPQKFLISRFLCAFFDENGLLPASHPIYWKSCVQFRRGDLRKIYWHSPCWAIACPAAVVGKHPGLSVDDLSIVKNSCAMGKLSIPVELRAGLDFAATLLVDTAFPEINFVFLMEGDRARSLAG